MSLSEKDVVSEVKEVEDLQAMKSLPSPAVASSPKPKIKLSATAIIPIWICLSSTVIIYNNYLYNSLNFKYPVFTVTWHLTFAVSASQIVVFEDVRLTSVPA
jgi:hypothetical protein